MGALTMTMNPDDLLWLTTESASGIQIGFCHAPFAFLIWLAIQQNCVFLA